MAQDNVIDLKKPESFADDPLTDILRQGARRLLATALEMESEGDTDWIIRNSGRN